MKPSILDTGPRWGRVMAYSPGANPAQGVNVTLLMYNSQTPLSEFLTVSCLVTFGQFLKQCCVCL